VAPKHAKSEIKEYLEKVYNVKVARITTSISLGKTRRVFARKSKYYRLTDYKRAMVQILEGTEAGELSGGSALENTSKQEVGSTPKQGTEKPGFLSKFFSGSKKEEGELR